MGSGASRDSEEPHEYKVNPGTSAHNASRAYTAKGGIPAKTKKPTQVGLTRLGFSPAELNLHEGEEVIFHWSGVKGVGHNVKQVVTEDKKPLPVIGGFCSGDPEPSGSFHVQFNLEGNYTFISDGYSESHGYSLTVTVRPRSMLKVEITESGFSQQRICIEEGSSVQWQWSGSAVQRTLVEVRLCTKHLGWLRTDTGSNAPSQTGWYKHCFIEPGLFYFMTEGEEEGQSHVCVVEVKHTPRHHLIKVMDKRFQPQLVTVEEGDRVWWTWYRFMCQKKHKIIEVELPMGHNVTEPFPKPVRGGFTSGPPSRTGMLSHIFDKPGVYYYCDNNYDDVRDYLGVVVVKPKAKEHHIEVTQEGFYPDLCTASAGDRILWHWDVGYFEKTFSIMQVESCMVGLSKSITAEDCNNRCKCLSDDHARQLMNLGVTTSHLPSMGVYHFRVTDTPMSVGGCSVIINAAIKDHVIKISEGGYEPHLLSIHPGDRVWWVWDGIPGQHNVVQVSQEGEPIPSGFCSGLPMDSPGAFHTCFDKEGVFYYRSAGLSNLYGAIMTVRQPQVHQVIVSKNDLTPDPLTVQSGDCVAWVWPLLRKHKLIGVSSTQEVFELQKYTQDSVSPRRCCALLFTNPGVFHYYSKAFSNKTDKFMYEHSSKAVLSTVVVSMPKEHCLVRVRERGFHPQTINITKGMSVVFTWKEAGHEYHNISLVAPPPASPLPPSPQSHTPLSLSPQAHAPHALQPHPSQQQLTPQHPLSPKQLTPLPHSPMSRSPLPHTPIPETEGGFSSGAMEVQGCFPHTFDDAGSFTVASQGARNVMGHVRVWDSDSAVYSPMPVSNDNGGVVQRGHQVDLSCSEGDATIYYTLDGSIPEPNGPTTRVLKSDQGITLKKSGLHILRAVAHTPDALPSDIYTSRRFWVLEGAEDESDASDNDAASIATEDFEDQQLQETTGPSIQWQWWQCMPIVQGWKHSANTLELYWLLPDVSFKHLIDAYHIYINGICYHNNLVPPCHSIGISGFRGGESYVISVVAMPTSSALLPQASTKLRFDCPLVSDHGGPVLSCEMTDAEGQLPLVWTPLPSGFKYQLFVTGMQYGQEIVPAPGDKQCRVTISDWTSAAPLKVHLLALHTNPIPNQGEDADSEHTGLLSNDLSLTLPLPLDSMMPPPRGVAGLTYLHIYEGSLQPPGPDVTLLPEVVSEEQRLEESEDPPQEQAATQEGVIPLGNAGADVKSSEGKSSETENQPQNNAQVGDDTKDKEGQVEYEPPPPLYSAACELPAANIPPSVEIGSDVPPPPVYVDACELPAFPSPSPNNPADVAEKEPDGISQTDAEAIHKAAESQESTGQSDGIAMTTDDAGDPPMDDALTGDNGTEQNKDDEVMEDGQGPEDGKGIYSRGANVDDASETNNSRDPDEPERHRDTNVNDTHSGDKINAVQGSDRELQTAIPAEDDMVEAETPVNPGDELKDEAESAKQESASGNEGDRDQGERSGIGVVDTLQENTDAANSLPNTHQQQDVGDERLPVSHESAQPSPEIDPLVNEHVTELQKESTIPAADDYNEDFDDSSEDGDDKVIGEQWEVGVEYDVEDMMQKPDDESSQAMTEGEVNIEMDSASMKSTGDDGSSKPQENLAHNSDSNEGESFVAQQNASQLSNEMTTTEIEIPNDDTHETSSEVKEVFLDHPAAAGDHNDFNANSLKNASPNASSTSLHDSSTHTLHTNSAPSPINVNGTSDDDDAQNVPQSQEKILDSQPLPEPPAVTAPLLSDSDSEPHLALAVADTEGNGQGSRMENLVPQLKAVRSLANAPEIHIHWYHGSDDPQRDGGQGSGKAPPSLQHYLVCVEGESFLDQQVNSHSRHEVKKEDVVVSTKHYWNAGRGGQLVINRGLVESAPYRVSVTAVYRLPDRKKSTKLPSSCASVTTGGRPIPPTLSLMSVGLQEVRVSWQPGRCHEDIEVVGYEVLKNNHPTGETVPYGITETTIKDFKPGSKSTLSLSTLTAAGGPRRPSNALVVICPRLPDPPVISLAQSSNLRSATITWPKQKAKHLYGYVIYVNGQPKGEVSLQDYEKQSTCRYELDQLMDDPISVSVKACAGWKSLPSGKAVCQVMSGRSNQMSIQAKTPPPSPSLRLEGMHQGGVDVMWEGHQQEEAQTLSGYVVLKDGQPYGSLLDHHVTRCTVGHVKPGSTLSLQVMAVSDTLLEPGDHDLLKRYPTCEAGPSLRVGYTGLVAAPSKVWTELVTGHSMLVVWHRGKKSNKQHYVEPDAFMVRWGKANKRDHAQHSMETKDDNLLIEDLEPGTTYSVMVEARKWNTYYDEEDEGILGDDDLKYSYLVTAVSKPITAKTARPPDPPSGLKVTSVGPKSIELKWTPAVEHGSEILGLKMFVTLDDMSAETQETVKCLDLLPDATEASITGLEQGKEFLIYLVAVTDDFFDQLPASHPLRKARDLPREWRDVEKEAQSPWLPCARAQARTQGNNPPSGLRVRDAGSGWVVVEWKAPSWGGYHIDTYQLEWEDVSTGSDSSRGKEGHMEGCVEAPPRHTHAKLHPLVPGRLLEIQVKAYMKPTPSPKSKSSKHGGGGGGGDGKQAKMNLILESDPISVRLPCKVQAPGLRIAGFSSCHVDLRWTKPPLMVTVKNKDASSPAPFVSVTLLGYRLMVEGCDPIFMSPTTNRYTLTQVKGGRTLKVHLVAVTTPKKISLRKCWGGRGSGKKGNSEKVMTSLLKSIGDNRDEAASSTLFITVPKHQSGNVISCTCTYEHARKADAEGDDRGEPLGFINVRWDLLDCGTAEDQGIQGYDVSWMCDVDGNEEVVKVGGAQTTYRIPITNLGCMYDISVQPIKDENIWQDLNSPSIQCEVPGPPAPPTLCCVSLTTSEFILEWAEPRTYGGVGVKGYQVYMNERKIGQQLSTGHFKAAVPCRANRIYVLGISALSDDPDYGDSPHDQELRLCTPDEDPIHHAPGGGSLLETLSAPQTPRDPQHSGGKTRSRPPRRAASAKPIPEDLELKLTSASTSSIGVSWDFLRSESIDKVEKLLVTWSSVAKPKENETLLSPSASSFTVKNCCPGTNHFITVTGLSKQDRKVCRSKQLIVQTSSQLGTPKPYLSCSSYQAFTLKWEKPKVYGGASIAGYRVRVNGHQAAVLPASTLAYTYRLVKMCQVYECTVQATCSNPRLNSDFSDPLEVTSKGVIVPDLQRNSSTRVNSLVVSWQTPEVLGGAKIRSFKVLCMAENASQLKQIKHSPVKSSPSLGPDARSTELTDLVPHRDYSLYLDVYLDGAPRPVRSRPLLTRVASRPPAPRMRSEVIGVDERRQLESDACSMFRDRDRLLQELFDLEHDLEENYLLDVQYQEDVLARVAEVSSLLADIETSLDICLEKMKLYTGTMGIAVSWDLVADDGDAVVTGYKVLVNGEQYGFVLHSQVSETVIKLNAYHGTHKLQLVAITDHPVGHSERSETIAVDTSPYRPFVSYCLHSVHQAGIHYPNPSCCAFQETLHQETNPDFNHLIKIHQHLPKRRVPAPSVTVYDQTQDTYRLLIPTKLSNRKPVVILFWTHWCLASQAIMSYFVSYAKKRAKKLLCVSMCCQSGEDTDTHRDTMGHLLSSRGWKDVPSLQHCCCCPEIEADGSKMEAGRSLNTGHSLVQFATEKKSSDALSAVSDQVPELFGVMAVPTVIVIHPEGYLGWKSCFAVTDQAAFASALDSGIIDMLRSNPGNFTSLALADSSVFSESSSQLNGQPPKSPGTGWSSSRSGSGTDMEGGSSAGVGGAKPRTPPIVSPQLRHFALKKKEQRPKSGHKNLISIDTIPYSANAKGISGKDRPNSSVTI